MNKSEFLAILREQLAGEIPSNEIYSNLHFYDQYIEREIASGKTEEEVMELLGDPRLIAKTLIDADGAPTHGSSYQNEGEYTKADGYSGYSEGSSESTETQRSYYETDDDTTKPKVHRLDLSTWYGKALLILAAGAIIFLIVTLLSALLPIIIIVVLVCVIMALFRKRS